MSSRIILSICKRLVQFIVFVSISGPSLFAAPFIDADNPWLRSDIEALADNHLIKVPVTQWPIMWASIGDDIKAIDVEDIPLNLLNSYTRVKKAYQRASQHDLQFSSDIAFANENAIFTDFGNVERDKQTEKLNVDYVGKTVAFRLSGSKVTNPYDGKDFRFDDSYLGVVFGNWAFSAGRVNRWWGPAWKSSQIMSSNARPLPSLSIQRVHATPFKTPWLSWMGSWTIETFMAKLEKDRAIPNALLWGARLTMRPTPNLELGLSRSAIWGGDGRPKDLNTFWRLLNGIDNVGNNLTSDEQPGNQQAGFDFRWNLQSKGVPASVYIQYIGEDKLRYMIPTKATIGYGLESKLFHTDWGSFRGYMEYSYTRTSTFLSKQTNNTIYEHGLYRSGYRYLGRVLGASWDNDSKVFSAGVIASNYQQQELSLSASVMNLNTDNTITPPPGGNSITPVHLKVNMLDARYRYYFKKSFLQATLNVKDKKIPTFGVDGKVRIGFSYHYEF